MSGTMSNDHVTSAQTQNIDESSNTPPSIATTDLDHRSDLTNIFKQANGSVVQITSEVSTVIPNIIINGNPLKGESTRLGSGFIYDSEGHIITNEHVVDGTNTVDITFVDGNTYTAKVLGKDEFSDIAVLQIADNSFSSDDEKLVPLPLGDSSKLLVGEQVTAIGNPFGLSDTLTAGIVSQVGRLLPNENLGFSIPNVIQTDAAINPGNSGGPLLDTNGEVIGMSTAIKSNSGEFAGIGFAIPSNTIKRIIPVLIENGSYSHPWLGISGTRLIPDLAEDLGLPYNSKGVIVAEVVKGGPADRAGLLSATMSNANNKLRGADIIVAVDGKPVKSMEDLIFYIEEYKAVGENMILTVLRGHQNIDLQAMLQARSLPST
jgi:S1-C subfamily serine protease